VKCISVQDEFKKVKQKMFESLKENGRKERLQEKVEINVSRWLY